MTIQMMFKTTAIIGVAFLASAFMPWQLTFSGGAINISAYELVVSPRRFVDQDVIVRGFLSATQSGRLILYPTEDDARIGNIPAGILFDGPDPKDIKKRCLNAFVSVDAKFGRMKEVDNFGFISVSSIELLRTRIFGAPSILGCKTPPITPE